jgi:glycerophosphoryl diester phosphodiesterase
MMRKVSRVFPLVLIPFSAGAVDVVVHRGANLEAPENTRAAAQVCIDLGAEYVEVDVRTSKDDVLYILHDTDLDRTTNGSGPLHKHTSGEIDQLDAGSWFDARFEGEGVPRLDEYLRWIKGKTKVYFDVKSADLRQLVALVRALDMEEDCFFWFSNPGRNTYLRTLDQGLPLKVNAHTPQEVREAHEKWGIQIVETSIERAEDADFMATCRDLDIRIMVYGGDESPEYFRRVLDSEADLINLDDVRTFVEVRDGRGTWTR